MSTPSEKSVGEFYDSLSSEYDVMTGFAKRWSQEEATFRSLVDQFKIKTALDAGCGTGFHSLLLAKLGVDVTGVDVSADMIARAKAHAEEMKVAVQFVASTFDALGADISSPVDAVFCLGNSLPHLLSGEALLASLRSFAGVLKAGGTLFLQILNYDRIMKHRNRVQSVKEERDIMFVRFYDFESDHIRFNILKLQRTAQGIHHQLDSVRLRPILSLELCELMSAVGFQTINLYGNAKLEPFSQETSVDLLVVARN